MEDKIIDFSILNEMGEDFNLEDYYTLIERKKMELYSEGKKSETIDKLETSITRLDRILQDLKGSKSKFKLHTYKESSKILSTWFTSVKDIHFDSKVTMGLLNNVNELTFKLGKINSYERLSQNIVEGEFLSLSTYYKNLMKKNNSSRIFSSEIVRLIKVDSEKRKVPHDKNFESEVLFKQFNSFGLNFVPLYSWEMNIKIKLNEDANKVFYFLWILTESINKIDGTGLYIEDWGRGSLWVKIKVFFKDLLAKKETKELLSKAYESGKAIIDKPTLESKKMIQETELLKKQSQTFIDPEVQNERDRLENQKLEADIEKTKAETLNIKVEALQKISHIMKEGILSIDSLEWDINGQIFLVKNKDIIEIKSNIEDIDSKSKLEKGN